MRKSTLRLGSVLLLGFSFFVATAGAEPQASRSRSRILMQDEQERYVYVTGSHIRQRVKLKSIGTTTPYNVRIYTKAELDSTGRFTPAGALALDPAITITGR